MRPVTPNMVPRVFQLTASRRGWQHTQLCWWKMEHFNSQPHEEADAEVFEPLSFFDISTHSLTKRLTERWKNMKRAKDISTHSLTKRLTRESQTSFFSLLYFNSQPHEEADGGRPHCRKAAIYFNSQPHEEADTKVVEALQTMIQFQLTASRRGWPANLHMFSEQEIFQLTASRRGWLKCCLQGNYA